jgi:hypothetical protein
MAVMDRAETRNGTVGQDEIAVKNPITGAKIGDIPVMSADEVRAAVARARAAQPAWNAQKSVLTCCANGLTCCGTIKKPRWKKYAPKRARTRSAHGWKWW